MLILVISSGGQRMAIYRSFDVSIEFLAFISFVVCVAAVVAVGMLLGWHIYLILTNQVRLETFALHKILLTLFTRTVQTTIEFYINLEEKSYASSNGVVFKNPFDQGIRKNFRRVFGDVHWLLALLMSNRLPPPPEFPFDIQEYSNYKAPAIYNV